MDIEKIKDKVIKNNFQLTKEEKILVSEAYYEISKLAGKARVLNLGCASCFITAYTIIQNYIKYHYQEPTTPNAEVEIVSVNYKDMTYKDIQQLLTNRGIIFKGNTSRKELLKLIE
jgi:hypothetical protein